FLFFFSSRRRHTISVSAFLLNRSSDLPTTLPTAYDVYPLDGRHDGGYYTVKDCVTIDVLPRTPGNNVYVGFMVWSNFTATKCRGIGRAVQQEMPRSEERRVGNEWRRRL